MTRKEIGVLVLIIILLLAILGAFGLFFLRYKKKVEEDSENGEYDLELLNDFKKNTNPKFKKRKLAFRILQKILSISLIVVVSALLVLGICDKLGLLKLGSKSIIVVASGSMSKKDPGNYYLFENNLDDQFPTFSIIVVEKVDAKDLKQYDTIVYKDKHGKNIIHRIVGKTDSGFFLTRGDANNKNDDDPVSLESVQGRYTGVYVPVLGAFVLFIQSPLGMATMVALIIGLILVDNTRNAVFAIHSKRMDFILEKLSLDEEKIQNLEDDDLKKLIESSDLKQSDESETQAETSENKKDETSKDEDVLNQNDKIDNTKIEND